MWWNRYPPPGRRVTKAFLAVRSDKISAVSGSFVINRAISPVNSSARPITARNFCRRGGRGRSMAAVNMS